MGDPAKKGVCSNYLCDAAPGADVKMTGPSGKVMLMPESKPETDLIVVATGTGIAPYRSMWKRLFIDQSFGVIPPGTNPKNGKPFTVRLYPIAASRYGDDQT